LDDDLLLAEQIPRPGATTPRDAVPVLILLKSAIPDEPLVAPTGTTFDIHAGQLMALVEAEFPDATTTTTPAVFNASTAALVLGVRESHVPEWDSPPRLMFTAAIGTPARFLARTHSRAASILELSVEPPHPKT
jgi:hypothetical protein